MMSEIESNLNYQACIDISKRVRWEIDNDVLRGRNFNYHEKFLPDGISGVHQLAFLNPEERRFLSQVQGRTYANMFGFVERFIVAKILEVSSRHWLRDQIALEAIVRFCDEELKHQELFRRIEEMLDRGMPTGYSFQFDPNEVAAAVLSKSTWAVMALILEIELFTQEHYKKSIETDPEVSELYRDIFRFHWKEETTHAMVDELKWPQIDRELSPEQRDQAVEDFVNLIQDLDGILQTQSAADVDYFLDQTGRPLVVDQIESLKRGVHRAYQWQ